MVIEWVLLQLFLVRCKLPSTLVQPRMTRPNERQRSSSLYNQPLDLDSVLLTLSRESIATLERTQTVRTPQSGERPRCDVHRADAAIRTIGRSNSHERPWSGPFHTLRRLRDHESSSERTYSLVGRNILAGERLDIFRRSTGTVSKQWPPSDINVRSPGQKERKVCRRQCCQASQTSSGASRGGQEGGGARDNTRVVPVDIVGCSTQTTR